MKQWKFNLLAAALLLPCGLAALSYLTEMWQMAGTILFIMGLYAASSGLYYHAYHKDREFEA